MSFYRRSRLYRALGDSRVSPLVWELLPKDKKLTLQSNLMQFFRSKQIGNVHTPFREIEIVPPERAWSKDVRALSRAKIPRRALGPKKFAQVMLHAMKRAIAEKWQPDKFHILMHSSGWDSRFISLALALLRGEAGLEWIGDLLFLEVCGEHANLREILKREGWRKKQLFVYRADSPPHEHFAPSFDFSKAWQALNGWCGYPINMNWTPFEWLHEHNIIPDPEQCQILSGYSANEIANAVLGRPRGKPDRHGIKNYLRNMYFSALSHFPLWGGESIRIFPYYHIPLIRTYIRNSKSFGPNWRLQVLHRLAPRVARVERTKPVRVRRAGYFSVSKRILSQCWQDYKASWFGREVMPDIRPLRRIDYRSWWGAWSLASFCEWLRSEGYEIEVES